MTCIAATAAISLTLLNAAPMSKPERQHVVAHLELTESWLADEVSNLSPAQLTYRYAPGKWTILDVVEHLTLAEPMYWSGLQKSMKETSSKPKQPSNDADMLWYGIDRTERQKTQAVEEPAGKLKDAQQGLASFRKLRATILDYARSTYEDLRGHVFTGVIDGQREHALEQRVEFVELLARGMSRRPRREGGRHDACTRFQ